VSLLAGLAVLALAVLVGGLAAVWREQGKRVMPGLATFATVAAAAIALLHLLPEAIADAGWGTLGAALAAFLGPLLIERLVPHRAENEDRAALLIGYAAVMLHQAGEGTAIASLSRAGELSVSIIIAIAAHTVPLAMVVALRSIEGRPGDTRRGRLAVIALASMALATAAGASSLDFVGETRIAAIRPWLVAAVAGFLLHALSHTPKATEARTRRGRMIDGAAGLLGLLLALVGVEHEPWVHAVPWPLRVLGLVVMAAVVIATSVWTRTAAGHPMRSDGRDPRAG